MSRADTLLAAVAGVSVLAVGAALVSQHVYDMQPCPWCVLQRLIFLAIAAAALLGLLWRSALGRRVAAGLGLALSAGGIAAALWQHFFAASATSCNLSWAERFIGATGLDGRYPDVFMAMTSCADAAVDLLGLPYEFWSLALFAALGGTLSAVLRRPA